ncbi:MAG: lysine 5,6-aminomutase subunit alpha TIM-barrel domain-containing protein, partial [Bacillota bacterium]
MGLLTLDINLVDKARRSAGVIAAAVQQWASNFTTTSIERATLRLMGVDGVDEQGIPLPNQVVDHLLAKNKLGDGAACAIVRAMISRNISAREVAVQIAGGNLDLAIFPPGDAQKERKLAGRLAEQACAAIRRRNSKRKQMLGRLGEGVTPYLYIIVATGSIFEDIRQAQAAARQGADIIAVIRSTGQSLLDYVPYEATTGGFGGTWATQENFRLMRRALDEVSEQTGRYIRLTNYCSGLCMPEIAVLGAMERLDMMLNDCMYGIIFRDINMQRTFIDQFFSRMVNAYAGIIINTGEDNYLTT